jgi:hypothetical protein
MPKLEQDGALWQCSSPMMRASVQSRRGLRRAAFGAGTVAGWTTFVFVVSAAVFTAAGRSTYFGVSTGFASSTALGVSTGFDTSACGCRVSTCLSFEARDRLREPAACAEADARTSAAIRMNLRL